MLVAENWMDEVAVTCGLPAEEVSWIFNGSSHTGLAYFEGTVALYLGHLPWEERIGWCCRGGQKLNFRLCPFRLLPPKVLSVPLLGKEEGKILCFYRYNKRKREILVASLADSKAKYTCFSYLLGSLGSCIAFCL